MVARPRLQGNKVCDLCTSRSHPTTPSILYARIALHLTGDALSYATFYAGLVKRLNDGNWAYCDRQVSSSNTSVSPSSYATTRHDCLEPLGLTVTEAANALGIAWLALNSLVDGRSDISPEMAIRLDEAFGGGTEIWPGLRWTTNSPMSSQNSKRHGRSLASPPVLGGGGYDFKPRRWTALAKIRVPLRQTRREGRHLQPRGGKLAGYWSFAIRAERRTGFRFEDGDVRIPRGERSICTLPCYAIS
jgi:addiction module HigA family antidote